jgi:hypothetical protein
MSGIGGFNDTARVGNLAFRVSPLLVQLGMTIDFEDALRRETGGEDSGD